MRVIFHANDVIHFVLDDFFSVLCFPVTALVKWKMLLHHVGRGSKDKNNGGNMMCSQMNFNFKNEHDSCFWILIIQYISREIIKMFLWQTRNW
jgi:hypothetical protein